VAQRVGRGIALLFHNPGTRMGGGASSTLRPNFTPPPRRKDASPIVEEAGWAPGPVWTGGKSRPHRDSILDRPACSQLLHRLSYPAHFIIIIISTNSVIFQAVCISVRTAVLEFCLVIVFLLGLFTNLGKLKSRHSVSLL